MRRHNQATGLDKNTGEIPPSAPPFHSMLKLFKFGISFDWVNVDIKGEGICDDQPVYLECCATLR